MDAELREALDHYQITKLLNTYCHGCDRLDQVRMASVYSAESWDDHGIYRDTGQRFAERISADMLATTSSVAHLQGQSLIHVDGDVAGAETYFLAVVRQAGEDGGEVLSQLGGRFVDALVREQGQWRIKSRIVLRDWSVSIPVRVDLISDQGLSEGQRSNSDPSFAALQVKHSGMPSV